MKNQKQEGSSRPSYLQSINLVVVTGKVVPVVDFKNIGKRLVLISKVELLNAKGKFALKVMAFDEVAKQVNLVWKDGNYVYLIGKLVLIDYEIRLMITKVELLRVNKKQQDLGIVSELNPDNYWKENLYGSF